MAQVKSLVYMRQITIALTLETELTDDAKVRLNYFRDKLTSLLKGAWGLEPRMDFTTEKEHYAYMLACLESILRVEQSENNVVDNPEADNCELLSFHPKMLEHRQNQMGARYAQHLRIRVFVENAKAIIYHFQDTGVFPRRREYVFLDNHAMLDTYRILDVKDIEDTFIYNL